jgi:hypothetical protein
MLAFSTSQEEAKAHHPKVRVFLRFHDKLSPFERERERTSRTALSQGVERLLGRKKVFGKVQSEIEIDREIRGRESMRTTISTKTVRSQGARASLDAFNEAPLLCNPRTCRRTQTQMHTRHYQVLCNLLRDLPKRLTKETSLYY